jgi:hypothetical protein
MPRLTGTIAPEGALVSISVGLDNVTVAQLRRALRPIPQPVTLQALLDTGAEQSGIDGTLIQTLALPFRATALVNLPAHGGFTVLSLHGASLTIEHPSGQRRDHLIFPNVALLDLPLAALGYQAVLGRDVLTRCELFYRGRRGRFRLAY